MLRRMGQRAPIALVLVLVWAACGDDAPPPETDANMCVPQEERCNGRDDDCDRVVDNGFDFSNDPVNCGACNVNCRVPGGFGACARAACQLVVTACEPFLGDCDDDGRNGCEADLGTEENCGECGVRCEPQNALGNCATGVCTLDRCMDGFGDCDEDEENGCEVDLTSDLEHCGECDNPCMIENGTPGCEDSTCTIASCDEGFLDCDDDPTTGCETTPATDPDHCGECDNPCPEAETCTRGTCG
jgi:hypothetical protein